MRIKVAVDPWLAELPIVDDLAAQWLPTWRAIASLLRRYPDLELVKIREAITVDYAERRRRRRALGAPARGIEDSLNELVSNGLPAAAARAAASCSIPADDGFWNAVGGAIGNGVLWRDPMVLVPAWRAEACGAKPTVLLIPDGGGDPVERVIADPTQEEDHPYLLKDIDPYMCCWVAGPAGVAGHSGWPSRASSRSSSLMDPAPPPT